MLTVRLLTICYILSRNCSALTHVMLGLRLLHQLAAFLHCYCSMHPVLCTLYNIDGDIRAGKGTRSKHAGIPCGSLQVHVTTCNLQAA